MDFDYVKYAKNLISDCNGTHPTEFVTAKSLLAIACALVTIAEKMDEKGWRA